MGGPLGAGEDQRIQCVLDVGGKMLRELVSGDLWEGNVLASRAQLQCADDESLAP